MKEEEVGVVTHYFGHIGVAGITMTGGPLSVGDTIHIKGHTSDFTSPVESIQVEHKSVPQAVRGDSIGIKVTAHAREHDKVYRVLPEA